ncbi:hypothetical protein Gotur_001968 [Gossypium turneri]
MDAYETGVQKPDSASAKLLRLLSASSSILASLFHFIVILGIQGFLVLKTKKGRPMKRLKNVQNMKTVEKAIAKNEKYAEKSSKIKSVYVMFS